MKTFIFEIISTSLGREKRNIPDLYGLKLPQTILVTEMCAFER